MAYEYLIRRFLPFSLGFLTAVFVTSLFQAVGSVTQTAHVPEVSSTSYEKPYTCKRKGRPYGMGSGIGHGSGTGVASADGQIVILHKPRPQYTDLARQNGTEGSVLLRVTFLANGEIGSVEPLNDLGDGLTEEAMAAARRIQFRPAKRDGSAVTTVKQVEYTFSIY